jgi:predicted transcriptional regulator
MVALELNFIKMHNMKYFLLLFTTILSLTALAQHNNIIIKDTKTLEALFKDTSRYKELSYGKTISDITLAGRIDKTDNIINRHKSGEKEWILVLFDGTQVWIGKNNLSNFNLDNLYKHNVQIKGNLLDGSIDIYEDSLRFESRGGYRIDAESIILSQDKSVKNASAQNINQTPLVIKIAAIKDAGAIGYAYVYRCKVAEVIKGKLKDTVITITILPKDIKKATLFKQLSTPIIITFKKCKENEQYNFSVINGFVDSNKTSWEIVDIKKKN